MSECPCVFVKGKLLHMVMMNVHHIVLSMFYCYEGSHEYRSTQERYFDYVYYTFTCSVFPVRPSSKRMYTFPGYVNVKNTNITQQQVRHKDIDLNQYISTRVASAMKYSVCVRDAN